MKYVNTDVEERVWPGLRNAATGRTLELQPGESAEVEGEVSPEDPYLKPTEPHVSLGSLPRAKLNERAVQAGVEDPESLPNRQAVIDAIEAHEASSADGEAPPESDQPSAGEPTDAASEDAAKEE